MWGFWVMPMQMIMTSVSTVRMTMFPCPAFDASDAWSKARSVKSQWTTKTLFSLRGNDLLPIAEIYRGNLNSSFLFTSTRSNSFPFLTWKIFVIFQVVVVGRFHFIAPSLPVKHLETRGGGRGGAPIWKGKGCSSENLNLTPTGDLCGRCLSFIIP